MPQVRSEIVAPGDPDRVYAVCTRMEDFARFMPDVRSVTVLERHDWGTLTSWDTTLRGRPFRWVERDVMDPDKHAIHYEQTQGDLAVFRGDWQITAVPEGCRVELTCEFEFGMPMLAALLNPVAAMVVRSNLEHMLAAVRDECQRQLAAG